VLGRGPPSHRVKWPMLFILRLQKCIYTSTPPNALVAWILHKLRHNLISLIQDETKHGINSGNQVSHSLLPSELKKFLTNSTPTGLLLTWNHSMKVILTYSIEDNVIPFSGERYTLI
jgi:hypothetical protein